MALIVYIKYSHSEKIEGMTDYFDLSEEKQVDHKNPLGNVLISDYKYNPFKTQFNPQYSPALSATTFGHDGLGGQSGYGDLNEQIGFGYITNWIPMVADGMARHREITRSLIDVLRS